MPEISVSRFYRTHTFFFLQPEKFWEADLEEMASLIDDRTRLIVVINPSNPCGSVYTKEQLEAILDGKCGGDGVVTMVTLAVHDDGGGNDGGDDDGVVVIVVVYGGVVDWW